VVSIAFPLLAGPGAITAVSIMIVIGMTYVLLRCVDRIYKVLGRHGSIIVTRVFAVLIAAIASNLWWTASENFSSTVWLSAAILVICIST
jgi:small neutral amino acid transporter SnatA (MarC family)